MEMRWNLPSDLLPTSVAIMRPHGANGHEGLALWFGGTQNGLTEVTHVVALHGPGLRTAPLQLRLSFRAFEVLTNLADRVQAHLVGQIHSHPARMLNLSTTDTTYGIRRQDYLSLVCPHYAQQNVDSVYECGVHVFDKGDYRRLAKLEIARRIAMTPNRVIQLSCEVPA